MKCDKCGMELQRHQYVLTKDGFIKVTPFYQCDICKEEYYDLGELKKKV